MNPTKNAFRLLEEWSTKDLLSNKILVSKLMSDQIVELVEISPDHKYLVTNLEFAISLLHEGANRNNITYIFEGDRNSNEEIICKKLNINYIDRREDMHFDVALVNPPYKKNMHLDFIEWTLQHANEVVAIHPSSWLFREQQKIDVRLKDALEGRVTRLKLVNGHLYFDAEFTAPLVILHATKKHEGDILLRYDNTGNEYLIENLDQLPTGYWEPTAENLRVRKKIIKKAEEKNMLDIRAPKDGGKMSLPVICGDPRIRKDDLFFRNDYFTFFYRNSDLSPKGKGFRAQVKNKDEVASLTSYLKTKFARYSLALNKIHNVTDTKWHLRHVPIPPLDRIWTDESIYEHFNMTSSDKKTIENFIPDYY